MLIGPSTRGIVGGFSTGGVQRLIMISCTAPCISKILLTTSSGLVWTSCAQHTRSFPGSWVKVRVCCWLPGSRCGSPSGFGGSSWGGHAGHPVHVRPGRAGPQAVGPLLTGASG